MSFLLPDFPDRALRQPATLSAVAPVFLGFYAQAVLSILPNTFILKLSLLPFILWQAWSCAMGLNFSAAMAKSLGLQNNERLGFWNIWFVSAMLNMALRSFEWTFIIKKPLRKYELPEGQDAPVERPLSIPNVLLDASDLFFNLRGIGWSWSSRPFPRDAAPRSIAYDVAKTFAKLTVLDTAHYIMHLISPSTTKTGGGSLSDATIPLLPHTLTVMTFTFFAGLWVYARLELTYHVAMLIGRIILRQPASCWPPFLRRPWMATSIGEFWGARWHQLLRHIFVVFGARPGGAILGRPGAVLGGFAMSGLMHSVGQWGMGHEADLWQDIRFFVLMGVGVVLESGFHWATGLPVRGWFGRLWTMAWMLWWGSFVIDSWAKSGFFATDFVPDHLRPGKFVINGVVSLFSNKS